MTYDEEKTVYNKAESDTIEHMKKLVMMTLANVLNDTGHAEDTQALIAARFSRALNMDVIAYFNQLHAMEG